jgi:hypothetical protein
MLQNSAIDVAIALSLMYLMLSLFCTVVNEYIATKLKLRATSLASALTKFLDDPHLRAAFYGHGLIVHNRHATATGLQSMPGLTTITKVVAAGASALATGVRKMTGTEPAVTAAPAGPADQDHPSYLSSRSVALALIGSLDPANPVPGIADIRNAVMRLPASSIRDTLLASLTEAGDSIDKLRTSIATWFDDSMERLSGAYKRKLKWISFLIGLGVTVAFNADSLNVAKILWTDADRRAAAVAAATKAVQTQPSTPEGDQALRDQLKATESALRSLPIGWGCVGNTGGQSVSQCVVAKIKGAWGDKFGVVTTILGWAMTIAALTLGAPFWFDTLQKFVNLRGAGAKPKREDEKTRT